MDKLHLVHNVDQILSTSRYPVSRKNLEDKLECSRSTVNRLIQYMRDSLGAPIKYDRKGNGYCYDQAEGSYQLPGLWFNTEELYALLSSHKLLSAIQPGLFEAQIKPLQKRIENILNLQKHDTNTLHKRIIIIQKALRPINNTTFQLLSSALLEQEKITIQYHGRSNNQTNTREISPQRIIFYNNTWYLDAWCHTRDALRTFSVDRISKIKLLHKPAKGITDKTLDEHLASSYGIFGGKAQHTAKLLFSQQQSQWIVDEQWHPQQQGKFLNDGRYELHIPYSNNQELLMDILKYGPEVEVIAPEELRQAVKLRIKQTLEHYEKE